jgi:hypothetical protein
VGSCDVQRDISDGVQLGKVDCISLLRGLVGRVDADAALGGCGWWVGCSMGAEGAGMVGSCCEYSSRSFVWVFCLLKLYYA